MITHHALQNSLLLVQTQCYVWNFGGTLVICNFSNKIAHFKFYQKSFTSLTEKNKNFNSEIQVVLFILAAFSIDTFSLFNTLYLVELTPGKMVF